MKEQDNIDIKDEAVIVGFVNTLLFHNEKKMLTEFDSFIGINKGTL